MNNRPVRFPLRKWTELLDQKNMIAQEFLNYSITKSLP